MSTGSSARNELIARVGALADHALDPVRPITNARRLRNRIRARRGPIGIAFGGGGARGLAHIGVIEALAAYPILQPRIFAGTSVGSLVAVMLAAGHEPRQVRDIAINMNWFQDVIRFSSVLDLSGPALAGIFPNVRLAETVNRHLDGRTFDDLPYDCIVTASDVERRRRVVFTSKRVAARMNRRAFDRFLPPQDGYRPGVETVVIDDVPDVGLAVRASCAVPGFFRPVTIRGMNLVDGGVLDQTPVNLLRAAGARFRIGVSLGLSFMPGRMLNPAQALSATIGALAIAQLRRSLDDAHIGFQVTGIDERSPIKPRQLDLIEVGRLDMMRQLIEAFGGGFLRRHAGPGAAGTILIDS